SLPLVLFMTQPDVNRTRTEGFFANVTFTFFVDNVRQRLVRAIHWRREELEGPSYFGIAYVIAERNLDMLLSIAQENERAVTALAKAYSSSHIESPFIVSVVHNAEFETLLSQVLLPPFIEKYLRLEKHWWYDEFELRAALS